MTRSSHVSIGATTQLQVAFVGPVGVGKTTAVRAISEIPVVSTEVMQSAVAISGQPVNGKFTTTVGIDYGEWQAPTGQRVGIFGTPGQVRFSSARTSVIASRSRVILWVYGNWPDLTEQIESWMEVIGDETLYSRTTVAVTRMSEAPQPVSLEELQADLGIRFPGIKILSADPRSSAEVNRVIMTALNLVSPHAEAAGT